MAQITRTMNTAPVMLKKAGIRDCWVANHTPNRMRMKQMQMAIISDMSCSSLGVSIISPGMSITIKPGPGQKAYDCKNCEISKEEATYND
jgi:hypothetical protein